MKRAKIFLKDKWAGMLTEDETGFTFQYNNIYLNDSEAEAISLTMPLKSESFQDKVLFPFFDGLIPEGWLLDIAERSWKISQRDRMSLLLACCKDCIGAVSVVQINSESNEI
jgi:serine/threonine-protein kinase HipA